MKSSYRLQVTGCRLQVAGCRLQAAGCRLQVTGFIDPYCWPYQSIGKNSMHVEVAFQGFIFQDVGNYDLMPLLRGNDKSGSASFIQVITSPLRLCAK
ncbi:MAG: hypothetical protein KKA81_11065 [Bacteroidetes bacterium]|nr:hypothetical protein [Bacteroidota bacterium]